MLTQSSGWQLTLSHPDTGRTVAPDVLGDPEFLPSLNSLVEVRIPVRRSPDWVEWPDGTDMELRLDGRVQPVDELVDIEQEAGRTVLVGEGGTELEDRVTAEYQSERRHIAAGELIEANTTYAADVDTPTATTLFDELQQSADTTAEYEAITNWDDTVPGVIGTDRIRPAQSCFHLDARTDTTAEDRSFANDDNYTDGQAALLSTTSNFLEYEVTPEYDITDLEIRLREEAITTDDISIRWLLDGSEIFSYTTSELVTGGGMDWRGALFYGTAISESLSKGTTHTFRIEVTAESGGQYVIDRVALFDRDFESEYTFDNTPDTAGGQLDGPGFYADNQLLPFIDATTPFSYTAGSVTTTVLDGAPNPTTIQLSPDRGTSWQPTDGSETDTLSIDTDFDPPTATMRARVGLGGWESSGPRDDTPRLNYDPVELDTIEVRADVSQESLLIDAVFDDSLESILNEIAGDEYVWSYRIENGTPTVSWTQPGERTADREPDFEANVSVNKQLRTWDAVTIQGSAQTVSSEPFDASETFTELVRDRIIPGSESVVDPSDGTQFVRGDDYEMRYLDGEIRLAADSDMVAATEYNIDYRYEAQGIHPPDYTGSNTLVETIPGIVSDRQAEQIAYVLLEIDPGVDSPRWTADVLLPRADQSFDPLEALSLVALELPDDATPLSVREPPDVTPEGIALRLGSRRALESALRSISNQVRTVSRRS